MGTDELKKILSDKGLARLGDAYINFIYSLALTEIQGKPTGVKVSDSILANAARASGLRGMLPKRMGRNDIANAAEALLVYAWQNKLMACEEAVEILRENPNPQEGLAQIIGVAKKRIEQLHNS